MEIKVKYKVIMLFLLMLIIGSCSGTEDDIRIIKDTIQKYVTLLQEVHAKSDVAVFKDVTTPNEMSRIEHRIEGLKKAKIRMETTLKGIEFIKIEFEIKRTTKGKTAIVKTREEWYVRHVDSDSGKMIKEIKALVYVLSYTLVQKNEKWLVDSAAVIEEREPPRSTQ